MFGRKGSDDANHENNNMTAPEPVTIPRASETNAPRSAAPAVARRIVEMPGGSRRSSSLATGEERKLTVGKGLSLAGEIASCDVLVVEGKVEARLTEGKLLEITESGQFRGSVEIENADIAGRYDGELSVHGRLTVRATGRISGIVRYGELEISAGGQIIGEMQVVGVNSTSSSQTQADAGSFKNAARYAALGDESDTPESKNSSRKSA